MRIAIDLTSTPKSKTGIGRYMLGLLKGLQEIDGGENSKNEYFLFMQDDDLEGFGLYAPNFHKIPVNSKVLRKQYFRIVWEQIVFPWKIKKYNIDILHCPNYTMPYPVKVISKKTKVVDVFHDMTYFAHPEYLVGWKCKMFQWYIKHSAKKADKIITISEASKTAIPNYCNPRNPDISVTYMGVKEDFFESKPADKELLSKYGIDGRYVIYVGTLEPRKNVPNLIRGFRKMLDEKSDYKMVIVGKKGWLYEEIFKLVSEDSKLNDRVIFTGFVEDDDMMRLMRSSSAVSYISFYEGFGIPVIEGMASGVPTVTTNVSSLAEVAADCGFLCSPDNVDEIAKALSDATDCSERIISGDKEALELQEKALQRAKFFSWQNCAKATLQAYQSIM